MDTSTNVVIPPYTVEQVTKTQASNVHDVTSSVVNGEFTLSSLHGHCKRPQLKFCAIGDVKHVPVLQVFDRDWISWNSACEVVGIGRQLLNYRFMNLSTYMNALRMDGTCARALDMYLGNPFRFHRSVKHGIFFDVTNIFDLAAVPTRSPTCADDEPREASTGDCAECAGPTTPPPSNGEDNMLDFVKQFPTGVFVSEFNSLTVIM